MERRVLVIVDQDIGRDAGGLAVGWEAGTAVVVLEAELDVDELAQLRQAVEDLLGDVAGGTGTGEAWERLCGNLGYPPGLLW